MKSNIHTMNKIREEVRLNTKSMITANLCVIVKAMRDMQSALDFTDHLLRPYFISECEQHIETCSKLIECLADDIEHQSVYRSIVEISEAYQLLADLSFNKIYSTN